VGTNRRYESSIDARRYGDAHPPVSLSEEAAGVSNRMLRRCEPPIDVRAWNAFRDGDPDQLLNLPASAEANIPRAARRAILSSPSSTRFVST
jgi:hypothetical protein